MSGIRAFENELSPYLSKKTKGTVQFPIDKKIPLDLVKKIVRYRVKENIERARKKASVTSKAESKKPQELIRLNGKKTGRLFLARSLE